MKRLKLCIVAHFAYGALMGGNSGHVGGVENQTSMLAKWLANKGHEVHFIVWDEGQISGSKIDNITVWKTCRQDDGLPVLRFFIPRWTSLIAAMKNANADIFYHNCAEYVTGQIAFWCRKNRKKFVYSVASDPECDPRLPSLKTFREKALFRYGIKSAHSVIAQTRDQQQMLMKGFNISSRVLPMPCPGPKCYDYTIKHPPSNGKWVVLWAGRIAKVKRLELLMDVARFLPDVQFNVAGGYEKNDGYIEEIMNKKSGLPNVQFFGKVNRPDMPNCYRNAHIFCCTSAYEGFPNTFIEAWSHGLPIVTTIDPDKIITDHDMGIKADNAAAIANAIKQLTADPAKWQIQSLRSRQYYSENHEVEAAMGRFEKTFIDLYG